MGCFEWKTEIRKFEFRFGRNNPVFFPIAVRMYSTPCFHVLVIFRWQAQQDVRQYDERSFRRHFTSTFLTVKSCIRAEGLVPTIKYKLWSSRQWPWWATKNYQFLRFKTVWSIVKAGAICGIFRCIKQESHIPERCPDFLRCSETRIFCNVSFA